MKIILTALMVLTLLAVWPSSSKAGCPIRADKLEDFARCMVPLKGTVGTATIYSSGKYDQDHRELMSAMASQAVVPPQVAPIAPIMPYPYVGFLSPYGYLPINFTGHPYMYNPYRLAPFYYPMYSRPNMSIYAYYRPY
ncbi:MAG: hypothetical protein ABH871_00460 [Pseudomonadota bacterium]